MDWTMSSSSLSWTLASSISESSCLKLDRNKRPEKETKSSSRIFFSEGVLPRKFHTRVKKVFLTSGCCWGLHTLYFSALPSERKLERNCCTVWRLFARPGDSRFSPYFFFFFCFLLYFGKTLGVNWWARVVAIVFVNSDLDNSLDESNTKFGLFHIQKF